MTNAVVCPHSRAAERDTTEDFGPFVFEECLDCGSLRPVRFADTDAGLLYRIAAKAYPKLASQEWHQPLLPRRIRLPRTPAGTPILPADGAPPGTVYV
jgi:hypothetical protein